MGKDEMRANAGHAGDGMEQGSSRRKAQAGRSGASMGDGMERAGSGAGQPGASVGRARETPLLEIENLRVSYPSVGGLVRAVRGVSFSVAAGQTCALVGESGCGKSVSAKAVMGLVRAPGRIEPSSTIRFAGTNVLGFSERQWCDFRGRNCALIFQDALASLNPTMRVGRQLVEALDNHCPKLSAAEKRRRAIETLRLTEIPDPEACMRRYPHELSGGMRQRVMIASAMVARPRLLIADEPTTSLDVTVQQQALRLMGDLQRQFGTAVLLITHDLGIVADVADRVVVMYAGRIVEQGPRDEIFYRPAHPYTEALLASVPRLDAPAKQGLRAIEGALPDPTSEPAGCAFCERCPHAMRICAQQMPATVEIGIETTADSTKGGTHEVTCWLHDPRYLAATGVPAGRLPRVVAAPQPSYAGGNPPRPGKQATQVGAGNPRAAKEDR